MWGTVIAEWSSSASILSLVTSVFESCVGSLKTPKEVSGKRGDACSDIYALGVILYEILTGTTSSGHRDF